MAGRVGSPRAAGGLRRGVVAAVLAMSMAVAGATAPPLQTDRLFHSIGDASTITDEVVTSIAQDRDGFLWIGSAGNLVRHDGYRLRVHAPDRGVQGALPGSFIRALLAARDGRLWVGTESDGLAVYDPRSERFEVPPFADPALAGRVRSVLAFAEDDEGAVYIGTVGAGVLRFDPRLGSIAAVSFTRGDVPAIDERVQSLLLDRDGDLWIGGWTGLARVRRGSDVLEPMLADGAIDLSGRWIWRLFQARDGRLWIGSRQGDLVQLDPRSGAAQRADTSASPAFGGVPMAFVQPDEHRIWVGGTTGIGIFDARSGRLLEHEMHDPSRPWGLAAPEVRELVVDAAGLLWVGGYGLGLQRHDPTDRGIRVRRRRWHGFDGVLQQMNIGAVHVHGDGRLWLGARGLAVLGPDLEPLDGFAPQPGVDGALQDAYVLAITDDGADALWIGSDANLFRLDLAGRRFERIDGLAGGSVRRLLRDSTGTLWIAMTGGLYRLEPGRRLPSAVDIDSGAVSALVEDDAARLWIGASRGLFVQMPGEPLPRRVDADAGDGLQSQRVVGLLADREGRLWVDTANGLHRMLAFDGTRARFDPVSRRHGIDAGAFGANLLDDRLGRIWTHRFVYDPASDQLHALQRADGIDFGTGWFRAYDRTADGRLLFGGSRGLAIIEPERWQPWTYAPPLVVTELRIDGERRPAGTRRVQLAVHERAVAFELAALDYSAPEQIRYRWRLHGYDSDWIEGDADYRVAAYANLSPGRYRFQAQATNRNGHWNATPLEVELVVTPAWWQSSWFAALLVLGSLLLVATLADLLARWRTGVLARRERRLQAEIARRTAELEAATEALRATSRELEEASLTDPLTGLRNRRFLASHVEADAALALRRHASAAAGAVPPTDADLLFFLIDIDRFKSINDHHGHAAGDAVLVQMRERLQMVFRDSDHLARWGGEEFLVVARGADRRHAAELAERVRRAVAEVPFRIDGERALACTCSIGFAAFPLLPAAPRAVGWQEVVDIADRGLLAAKRAGRNGWVGVHADRADAAAVARLRGDIARLLADGDLELVSMLDPGRVHEAFAAGMARE